MGIFNRKPPQEHRYLVFLYELDGKGNWMYEVTAEGAPQAEVTARLIHIGKGLPEVENSRTKSRRV